MLIEFHGDNKLLNEFVIMGDRSNNAIKLTFKVKGRKTWLSNGLWWFESMQAVCSFLRARKVIKFILWAVGALYKTQIASSERYVNLALAGCFFNKRKCFAPSNPGDWSKFCEQKQSSFMRFLRAVWAKAKFCKRLNGTICAIPLLLLLVILRHSQVYQSYVKIVCYNVTFVFPFGVITMIFWKK